MKTKEMIEKFVDAFVSNASGWGDAIGTIASTCAITLGLALPAFAETLCSGESAEVKLDLATGTVRTPAATETLTYSSEWDDGDAVTLKVNGTALASGLTGDGTFDWTPSGIGLFTLTHTTMTSSGEVVLTAIFEIPAVTFTPAEVEHAQAAVYTNAVAIAKTGESYILISNATATVVYTVTEPGYYFADATTTVTNDIDTAVNPATADAPAAPVLAIRVGDDAWAVVADGVCTVVGTGDMWSYAEPGTSPLWGSYAKTIRSLSVAGQVTGVGTNFFAYMKGLREVTLGASVTNVAAGAFFNSVNVTNVVLGAGVQAIGKDAFRWCNSLGELHLGSAAIAGLDEAFTITAHITMVGGEPVIDTVPKLVVDGYTQKLKGKRELSDETWETIADPAAIDPKYHFFRVEFEK